MVTLDEIRYDIQEHIGGFRSYDKVESVSLVSSSECKLIFPPESYKILGSKLREEFYQKALKREFILRGIPFESQKFVKAMYKGDEIGYFKLDFVVFGKIVVEIKACEAMSDVEFRQVNDCLVSGGNDLGILVNFRSKGKVEYVRVIRKNYSD